MGNAITTRASQIVHMDDKAASGMGDRATSSSAPAGKRKKTTTLGNRDRGERDTTSRLEANRRTGESGARQAADLDFCLVCTQGIKASHRYGRECETFAEE